MAAAQARRDDHVGEQAAEHGLAAVAEDALGGRVELDDAAVVVHPDDAVERGLDGRPQARLAALQLALAHAPLGDVADDREHVRLAAVVHRDHAQVGVEAAAVGAQRDRLDARFLALQRALDALAPLGDIAGREGLGIAAARRQLLAREAVEAQERRVDVDDLEVRVAQHERVGRGLEDRAVLLLAQAQRLLGGLLLGDVAAEREDARHAADLTGFRRTSSQCERAVAVAAPPLERRAAALLCEREVAARVGFASTAPRARRTRERRAEDSSRRKPDISQAFGFRSTSAPVCQSWITTPSSLASKIVR